MATISELNRSTEEKLDVAREKLRTINERIYFGNERNRDMSSQRRRHYDIKRTISVNSNSSNSNRNKNDDDYDDEEEPKIVSSRVVVSKDNSGSGITKREQIIAIQSRQNDLGRNKRMFGSLLGTLQKFKKEENFLKTKEEKKAKIEKKLEEQEQLEKIKMKEEREALIANRKRKQMEVKILETKMSKLQDLQVFEDNHKKLSSYIRTSSEPPIFWLPKTLTLKTSLLRDRTAQQIKNEIEERRKQVDEEIKNIESQIDRDCDATDDHHPHEKSSNNHNDAESNENGREKEEESNGRPTLKRGRDNSYSPEVKKRICSQVVVKSKE